MDYSYKCSKCGKPAKWNFQDVWKVYKIVNDDEFEEYDEWQGNTNEFYCDDCAKEENIIK